MREIPLLPSPSELQGFHVLTTATALLFILSSLLPFCAEGQPSQLVPPNPNSPPKAQIEKATQDIAHASGSSHGKSDPYLVDLRLGPQISPEALLRLNALLEPQELLVSKDTRIRAALTNYFGADREDLVKLVVSMNPALRLTDLDKPSRAHQNAIQLLVPGIPRLSHDEKFEVPEGADVFRIARAHYGKLTGSQSRRVFAVNSLADGWSMPATGELLLPSVPGRSLVRLRNPLQTTSLLGPPNPNLAMPQDSAAAAVGLASLRDLGKAVQSAVPSGMGLTAPSSTLSSSGKDCKAEVDQGRIDPEWYVKAIDADRIIQADLPKSYASVAVLDSGLVSSDPSFSGIVIQVADTDSETVAYWPGIDVTKEGSHSPEDLNNFHHGTHVSGIATGRHLLQALPQSANSPFLPSAVRLLVVKLFPGPDERAPSVNFETALLEASHQQPHVYNMSFDMTLEGFKLDKLQDRLTGLGVGQSLYVIAAGNNGDDLELDAKKFPNVINPKSPVFKNTFQSTLIVAWMKQNGDGSFSISPGSSRSSTLVQIAAPGECVESNGVIDGKPSNVFLSGTSQAAPFVAYTAALIAAKHSTRDGEFLKRRILETCDWDKNLEKEVANGCRLDMAKALATQVDVVELRPDPIANSKPALLRGTIVGLDFESAKRKKFNISGENRPSHLRRIWFGDDTFPSVKILERDSSGRYDNDVLSDQVSSAEDVLIQTEQSVCPQTMWDRYVCRIPIRDVRDIILADVDAKNDF